MSEQNEERRIEGRLFVFVLIKLSSTFAVSLEMINRCQVVLEPTSPSSSRLVCSYFSFLGYNNMFCRSPNRYKVEEA